MPGFLEDALFLPLKVADFVLRVVLLFVAVLARVLAVFLLVAPDRPALLLTAVFLLEAGLVDLLLPFFVLDRLVLVCLTTSAGS